jgi:hypothetical protein
LLTLFVQEELAEPAGTEAVPAARTRPSDVQGEAGSLSHGAAAARAANPPAKRLLKSFDDRIRADLSYVRAACGYEPAYFTSRVISVGAHQAVRELLADDEARFNWRRLAKSSLLHKSPAGSVLDPEFSGMFSRQELAAARKKLYAFELTDDVEAIFRKAAEL